MIDINKRQSFLVISWKIRNPQEFPEVVSSDLERPRSRNCSANPSKHSWNIQQINIQMWCFSRFDQREPSWHWFDQPRMLRPRSRWPKMSGRWTTLSASLRSVGIQLIEPAGNQGWWLGWWRRKFHHVEINGETSPSNLLGFHMVPIRWGWLNTHEKLDETNREHTDWTDWSIKGEDMKTIESKQWWTVMKHGEALQRQ